MTENIKFREEFQVKHFWLVDCACSRFTTLQWTTNPTFHLFYRLFAFIYCISWFIADLAVNTDAYYIVYMTHWGQIIMLLYFGIALSVSVKSFVAASGISSTTEEHDHFLKWYHKIMWVLLNAYVTVSVVITIAYWVGVTQDLITPNKSVLSVNVHVHLINTVLAVIEVALNNLPIRILHFYFPVIVGAIYVFFSLILFWAGSISAVYDVLDWGSNPGKAAAFAVGVVCLAVPIFHIAITYGLYRTRAFVYVRYWSKKFGTKHKLSTIVIVNGRAINTVTQTTVL